MKNCFNWKKAVSVFCFIIAVSFLTACGGGGGGGGAVGEVDDSGGVEDASGQAGDEINDGEDESAAIVLCDHTCTDYDLVEQFLGDGNCDPFLNCAAFDFDNGDCNNSLGQTKSVRFIIPYESNSNLDIGSPCSVSHSQSRALSETGTDNWWLSIYAHACTPDPSYPCGISLVRADFEFYIDGVLLETDSGTSFFYSDSFNEFSTHPTGTTFELKIVSDGNFFCRCGFDGVNCYDCEGCDDPYDWIQWYKDERISVDRECNCKGCQCSFCQDPYWQ